MKMFVTNQKITLSILMVIALLCGLQGTSDAQDDSPAVELQASTAQVLTAANAKNFVVTLVLEGAAWAEISEIRPAVSVSGIDGVEIKEERYDTGRTKSVWVCTSGCGGFVEFGYWSNRTVYAYRPSIQRKSDTVLEVPLAFNGDAFDFDAEAMLTFTVEADAIVDYNDESLTAIMPVITAVPAPLPLTEQNLGGSVVRFTLTGGRYAAQLLEGAVTVSGLAGVGVSDVVRKSDTVLEVSLTFNGTDFDVDTALMFNVEAGAIADYTGDAFTAKIPVTGFVELTEREQNLAIYWTNFSARKIQRANLNGSNVQDLVTGLDHPIRIALDVVGGKMYWTGEKARKIQRANLDGSNVQDLVTQGLREPKGIALDVVGGKMYWTDSGTNKIQRANLDGSNVEDLVTTGLQWITGIALDVVGGKMYWPESYTRKIQRANLDGSNVEDLVTTGLSYPGGIALDVVGGKMYWTDGKADKIQRANLDGSNVETLVTTGLGWPQTIALDVVGGKMYWTDSGAHKIQRANLDGSNVEDLVTTGLSNPFGIAIGILSPVNSVIAKEDVNRDGVVDVLDLAYVGLQYGKTGTNPADVNGDGIVNVDDFVLVAAAVDKAAAAAPAARAQLHSRFTASQLQTWLTEARASGNTSRTYQRGIAVIEQLLALLAPETTALLANYPNPFNPETWIPYQLSKPASVTLTIYNIQGHVVRALDLGHQRAGLYKTRSRAAYWDGRNAVGEPVASGLYFYTLTAGDFTATRKMLIAK